MPYSPSNPRFCHSCRIVKSRCLCAVLKCFDLPVNVHFQLDLRELKNSRNTSWLAHKSLSHSTWQCDIAKLPATNAAVLFPSEDAAAITEVEFEHLIIPDGTWSQAKALMNSWPKLPKVRLAGQYQGQNSRRKAVADGHLCTLEAVMAALSEYLSKPELLRYGQQLMQHYNALETKPTL